MTVKGEEAAINSYRRLKMVNVGEDGAPLSQIEVFRAKTTQTTEILKKELKTKIHQHKMGGGKKRSHRKDSGNKNDRGAQIKAWSYGTLSDRRSVGSRKNVCTGLKITPRGAQQKKKKGLTLHGIRESERGGVGRVRQQRGTARHRGMKRVYKKAKVGIYGLRRGPYNIPGGFSERDYLTATRGVCYRKD